MLNLSLIPLVAKAMSVLHAGKRDNMIYNAAWCFGEQRHGDVGPIMPLDRMPFIAVKAHLAFFNSILYKCCYTTNSDKVWEMVVLMHLSMFIIIIIITILPAPKRAFQQVITNHVKPQRGGSDICGAFDFLSNFQSNVPLLGNKYWSNTLPFCNKLQ